MGVFYHTRQCGSSSITVPFLYLQSSLSVQPFVPPPCTQRTAAPTGRAPDRTAGDRGEQRAQRRCALCRGRARRGCDEFALSVQEVAAGPVDRRDGRRGLKGLAPASRGTPAGGYTQAALRRPDGRVAVKASAVCGDDRAAAWQSRAAACA